MAFTPEQTRILEAAFTYQEHGFLQGNPYIRKSAIRRRLTLVDPAWQSSKPEFVTRDGDTVMYSGALVVAGIIRHDLGTGLVNSTKKVNDNVVPVEGYELARAVAKAHKQAASDVLPRAALQFGVGQYLKDKPKGIGERDFAEWLAGLPQLEKPHWAANGARDRVNLIMKALGLAWPSVAVHAEEGRILTKLTDTTLTEGQFILRLIALSRSTADDAPLSTSAR